MRYAIFRQTDCFMKFHRVYDTPLELIHNVLAGKSEYFDKDGKPRESWFVRPIEHDDKIPDSVKNSAGFGHKKYHKENTHSLTNFIIIHA